MPEDPNKFDPLTPAMLSLLLDSATIQAFDAFAVAVHGGNRTAAFKSLLRARAPQSPTSA